MICQHCGQKEFTLKITRIVNGQAHELKVCDECAAKISPYHAKIAKQTTKQSVESLLKDLLEQHTAPAAGALAPVSKAESGLVCASCGLDFARYKQTFMLGCPDCYDQFGERLLADIRRIHGAAEHKSSPTEAPEAELLRRQARARVLRQELEECLEREEFARAARIRDELRGLELPAAADGGAL